MARDANIYGTDDTAFATSVSSAALRPANEVVAEGAALDQEARSKGNVPDAADEKTPAQILKAHKSGGGDTEALEYINHPGPRGTHEHGPRTSESQEKYFKPVPLKRGS